MNRVLFLPPYRIPSRCRHFDILKNILVHCRDLSFATSYTHIKAHQDNHTSFKNLDRTAQLNCICDHAAKFRIATDGQHQKAPGTLFPLETVGVYVRGEKMSRTQGAAFDTGCTINLHGTITRNKIFSLTINSMPSTGDPSIAHFTSSRGFFNCGRQSMSSK